MYFRARARQPAASWSALLPKFLKWIVKDERAWSPDYDLRYGFLCPWVAVFLKEESGVKLLVHHQNFALSAHEVR